MRKDVKIGMLIGTGLCLVVAVWFCMNQQVVEQPQIEPLLPQDNLKADISPQTIPAEEDEEQVYMGKNQTAPQPSYPASAGKTGSLRIHIVQPGQTLSDISKTYYNTTEKWKKIYEANKKSLPNGPDTVRVGMKLVIPE